MRGFLGKILPSDPEALVPARGLRQLPGVPGQSDVWERKAKLGEIPFCDWCFRSSIFLQFASFFFPTRSHFTSHKGISFMLFRTCTFFVLVEDSYSG